MDKRVLVLALVLPAVFGAILWLPWVTKDRVVTAATPVPQALGGPTPAPLKGGSSACLQQVTFDSQTRVGLIGVRTGGKPGPPLDITAKAPGYRAATRVAAGYHDNPTLPFTLTAASSPTIGTLCIRNSGKAPVNLDTTSEFRTMGRPTLVIDGVAQPMDASLAFYDTGRSSYASRTGQILGHAAIFTPAFFSQTVLTVIAVLALLGITAGIAFAMARAWGEDERRAG